MSNIAGKTILFVREVPWGSVFPISTRMIAGEFANNGWNVIWITAPLMPWHFRAKGPVRHQLLEQNRCGGMKYQNGRVFSYTPRVWLPFSRHWPLDRPFLCRNMWKFCVPSIKEVLRRSGMPRPDVLWLSLISAMGLRRMFPRIPAIHHVTDYYQEYATTPATCHAIEKENYDDADHIVVTAPSLKDSLINEFEVPEDKITFISHGIYMERFERARNLPDPLGDIPGPRIVMLGNLGKLNFEVAVYLLENMQEASFLAIGPETPEIMQLSRKYANLRPLGAVMPEEVPSYLVNCDVGLVLFSRDMSGVVQHINPMKMYEYAAAGLPVVSTPMPVYNSLDAPVFVAESPERTLEAVYEALERKAELRKTMIEFALNNVWNMRYKEALKVVDRVMDHGAGTET